MPKCQAVVGRSWRYQIPLVQLCQQQATLWKHGVGLCGTHFNAAHRKELEVVRELPILGDD